MIKVIYGAKGTGKTKQMIDAANAAVATAKGHLIFCLLYTSHPFFTGKQKLVDTGGRIDKFKKRYGM